MPIVPLPGSITQLTMLVFNRWGQAVFTSHSTDTRGWDGRIDNGEPLAGVYIYRIEIRYKNGNWDQYGGNVTLVK